jgi:hypothetical protein
MLWLSYISYMAHELINTQLDFIHSWLDLIYTQLDLIHSGLDLINTDLIQWNIILTTKVVEDTKE